MGMRGESNFRIKIVEIIGNGWKGELGRLPPELALLIVPNNLEYLYTKIRISTPAICALLGSAGEISLY
jgi:hypothetical protein